MKRILHAVALVATMALFVIAPAALALPTPTPAATSPPLAPAGGAAALTWLLAAGHALGLKEVVAGLLVTTLTNQLAHAPAITWLTPRSIASLRLAGVVLSVLASVLLALSTGDLSHLDVKAAVDQLWTAGAVLAAALVSSPSTYGLTQPAPAAPDDLAKP